MSERIILEAAPGTVLTDGSCYGRRILLESGTDTSRFYPITEEAYAAMLAAEDKPAREGDYEAALREMGVDV